MDQAAFASWHDFYVTMGTASASLVGLLFVALSINTDAIAGPSRDDLRAFVEQAFASFATVLLIAVIFLIPTADPGSIGVAYLALGGLGVARMLRRTPAVWRGLRRNRLRGSVFWRFILPATALLGLVAVGLGFVAGQPSALYWLGVGDPRPAHVGRPQLLGRAGQGQRGPPNLERRALSRHRCRGAAMTRVVERHNGAMGWRRATGSGK